jgi:pyruvate/2-oxoglutarate dehydrogenase complex dihydrolipoamide acyltransferase (E2) component
MSRRRIGDRKDARRVRDISGFDQILIDLKPQRAVSDVFINKKIDMTNLSKYLDDKKKSGDKITYFHAFVAAIGKTIYNRPKLNRFVQNRHIYEHNEVVVAFVAKVSFDDASGEVMIMVPITKDDTVFTIRDKITRKVDGFRNKTAKKEGANSAIDVLGKLPNFIRIPVVGLFKWCDKKGHLPAGFVQDNLYYSSVIVSNLGAIGCGAIYHNITDFGNSSSLITMGEVRDEEVLENGKKQVRKLCEWGMNFDERIADGYYFAKSAQMLQHIFEHPEMLEEPAGTKIEMPEIRK